MTVSQHGLAMIDVSLVRFAKLGTGDGERPLRYSADDASSHEYEVKRIHMECLDSLSGRPIPVSMRSRPRGVARDLYGFRPIPAGGKPVTNELVNELREELGF